jgi:hypothetical protein
MATVSAPEVVRERQHLASAAAIALLAEVLLLGGGYALLTHRSHPAAELPPTSLTLAAPAPVPAPVPQPAAKPPKAEAPQVVHPVGCACPCPDIGTCPGADAAVGDTDRRTSRAAPTSAATCRSTGCRGADRKL